MYSDTAESVFSNSNDIGGFSGKVYDLNAICQALGTPYATRVVMAADQVNAFRTNVNSGYKDYRFFTQRVYPGHLNYDQAVGTGGAADLPKRLDFTSMLYCQYSDYKSERVD